MTAELSVGHQVGHQRGLHRLVHEVGRDGEYQHHGGATRIDIEANNAARTRSASRRWTRTPARTGGFGSTD